MQSIFSTFINLKSLELVVCSFTSGKVILSPSNTLENVSITQRENLDVDVDFLQAVANEYPNLKSLKISPE